MKERAGILSNAVSGYRRQGQPPGHVIVTVGMPHKLQDNIRPSERGTFYVVDIADQTSSPQDTFAAGLLEKVPTLHDFFETHVLMQVG